MLLHTIQDWFAQRCGSKGAALAFYSLFSMTPVLVLTISMISIVFGKKAAQGAVFEQLKDVVGKNMAHTIQTLVKHAHYTQGTTIATVIAFITLFIGATSVFVELKSSLDEIWHVPARTSYTLRKWFKIRILSLGIIASLAALLMASLVFSAALLLLAKFVGGWWSEISILVEPLSNAFSFIVIAGLFAVIYKMLPYVELSWEDVWIGSIGTATLFSLGQFLIGLYFSKAGIKNTYGAMGSLAVLLLWIYYTAQIFFFGATFTRQYALWFGSQQNINNHLNTVDEAN
jgi:membrane protein